MFRPFPNFWKFDMKLKMSILKSASQPKLLRNALKCTRYCSTQKILYTLLNVFTNKYFKIYSNSISTFLEFLLNWKGANSKHLKPFRNFRIIRVWRLSRLSFAIFGTNSFFLRIGVFQCFLFGCNLSPPSQFQIRRAFGIGPYWRKGPFWAEQTYLNILLCSDKNVKQAVVAVVKSALRYFKSFLVPTSTV
jgi:hypothetical protein